MRHYLILSLFLLFSPLVFGQALPRVYDDSADPNAQLDSALVAAASGNRHVICQVGGNWCKWCLRFADFITRDEEISRLVSSRYVYVHINSPRRNSPNASVSEKAMQRLGNPTRFGYPVMVVLDQQGRVLHTQDSSFLEEGESYNRAKVLRFLKNWTPEAVSESENRRK